MDVFVYGTLTDPDRVRSVLGDAFECGPPATLVGLRRVEGRYPTLAPPASRGTIPDGTTGGTTTRGTTDPDDEDPAVDGRVLRTSRIDALDDYEAVDGGLYVRVTVPVAGGSTEYDGGVEVYVGDPDRLGIEGVVWPGSGSFENRVRRYVETGGVRVTVER